MSDIIKIEHLNKCFGDVKAVNDLSFRVKKGELFASILVPPSTTASRTYELPLKRLAKPAANPVAAAPVPVAALPPRNTLPALLAPPATPVITRAAISSSIPIPEPVWATFSPIAAR